MCDTCGCNVTPGNEHLVAAGGHLAKTAAGNESVEVLKGLLDANDHQAGHNREQFARHNALADTMERARHYGAIARDALAIFPDGEIKEALLEAIEFSVDRPY